MEKTSEELKNLKIIIGQEPYNEEDEVVCKTDCLKSYNSYSFYQHFNSVAFVTRKTKPFKRTFENVLNLIYYKEKNVRNKYGEIGTNNNWIHFIEDMYEKHKIVFINQDNLDAHCKVTNQIINDAKAILMCGNAARDKINKILKSHNSKTRIFHSIHPSPKIGVKNERAINDWIFIETEGTFKDTKDKEYKHSVKKEFMI